MIASVIEIEQRLRALRSLRDRLVGRLRESAVSLREQQHPVPGLLDDLTTFGREFAEADAALVSSGTPVSVNAPPSIPELEQRLRLAHELQNATRLLDGIAALKHETASQQGLLDGVHAEVRRLKDQIGQGNHDGLQSAQSVLNGSHPLALLWGLVEHPESYSDEAWDQALSHVRAAFGRDVAGAVGRKRLRIPN